MKLKPFRGFVSRNDGWTIPRPLAIGIQIVYRLLGEPFMSDEESGFRLRRGPYVR